MFKFIIQPTLISNYYYYFFLFTFCYSKAKKSRYSDLSVKFGRKEEAAVGPLSLQRADEGEQEVLLGEQLAEQRQRLLNVGLDLMRKTKTTERHQGSSQHRVIYFFTFIVFYNRASPITVKPCQVFSNSRSLGGERIDL